MQDGITNSLTYVFAK